MLLDIQLKGHAVTIGNGDLVRYVEGHFYPLLDKHFMGLIEYDYQVQEFIPIDHRNTVLRDMCKHSIGFNAYAVTETYVQDVNYKHSLPLVHMVRYLLYGCINTEEMRNSDVHTIDYIREVSRKALRR